MRINRTYASIAELPRELRVFPLSCALLLPRGELPLNIFEPRYLSMIDAAMASDRLIGMIQPLPGGPAEHAPRLYDIGCVGRVTHLCETGDGRYLITLTGVARFKVESEETRGEPFRTCAVAYNDFAHDLETGAGEAAVDRARMIEMLRNFAEETSVEVDWGSVNASPTETLVNALAMMCPFGAREKQSLLEAIDLRTRAEILIGLAEFETARCRRGGREPPQAH